MGRAIHMEKVKYDLKVVAIDGLKYVFFLFLILALASQRYFYFFSIFLITAIVFLPVIVGTFLSLNKSKDGLYFSSEGVSIVRGKNTFDYNWNDVEISKRKVFFISTFIQFSLKGINKNAQRYEILNSNKKSLKELGRLYSKDEYLKKLFRDL